MPFRRMQELQRQDFTSSLLYVCVREFCAAGLSTHRTRETRQLFEGHGQQKGRLQGHLQDLRMGQHDMSHHLGHDQNPTPLLLNRSSASSVSSPNQNLNSDQCPIGLCPNIPRHPSRVQLFSMHLVPRPILSANLGKFTNKQ